MADLNIMKALKDPELELQTMPNPPAIGSATETAISVVTQNPTLEESLNDFDPEQYVEDTEFAASSPEQLPEEATQPPAQDALCTFHPNSTYKQTELELVAIENWMELLHTQTKSCIFLAKGNWQARQAATAISMAKGRRTCILSEKTCWACIVDRFPDVAKGGRMVTFIA
jgi:hypothetical protein